MGELAEWEGFYLIVGGASGALIGLQFVVLTLIAESPPLRVKQAGAAFITPTIVHFCAALLLSALLLAPWQAFTPVALLWGLTGLCGAGYVLAVARRMRLQTAYQPQFEDWLFHALLPLAAYAILPISALVGMAHEGEALFGVGAASLMLMFIGIHNAWDAIAYHVFVSRGEGI